MEIELDSGKDGDEEEEDRACQVPSIVLGRGRMRPVGRRGPGHWDQAR